MNRNVRGRYQVDRSRGASEDVAEALPHLVWRARADGAVDDENEKAAAYFGRGSGGVRPITWLDAVHPSERARAGSIWNDAVRAGTELEVDVPLRRCSDGAYRWHLVRAAPVRSVEGTILEWVGTCTDIDARKATERVNAEAAATVASSDDAILSDTDRRRDEQRVRDSEERYRRQAAELEAVYSSLPLGLAVLDREHRFVRVNERLAEMNGLPPDQHLGRRAEEIFPWLAEAAIPLIDRALASGDPIREAEILVDAGSGPQWMRCSYTPITRPGQPATAVSCVIEDITARKRDEERLLEADRQKDQFMAMLGHELRNPLAAIRSATELMARSVTGHARLERTQRVLDRQSAHMARLVDGLLDVSRLARGKLTLDAEPVDLGQELDQVVRGRAEEIAQGGLELFVDIEPNLWVCGDRVRLAQAFDNVIANAIKFTQAPGSIEITQERAGDRTLVRIRDSGIGISPDALPHIFEPLQQQPQEMARVAGGLGLGLALAKAIVDLHGGEIDARSEGPGTGAEVAISLPLTRPRSRHRPPAARAPASPADVLLVEDNVDAAAVMRELLASAGHQVELATTAPEALARARQKPPQIVLCDLGLPGMNGLELARAVRGDDDLRRIPLVAITGYGQDSDRRRSRDAGFDDHLTKPVDLDELEQVIARFLPDASAG